MEAKTPESEEVEGVGTAAKRKPRVFYGWWVVAVASLQGMFGNGTVSNGFSIFFLSVQRDLNVSFTAMSLIFSLSRAEGGMGGPLVGFLVDRYGARRMILMGGLLAGVGLVLISYSTAYWQFLVLFVGVVSVGKTMGLGQTLMAQVNQWFVRRRGLAMSTLMTSFAGGGAVVVPLLGLGISTIGWRDTLLYTGIFIFLLTIPVALVIRSKPEDMGLNPDGDDDPEGTVREESPVGDKATKPKTVMAAGDFMVRQAIRTSAFWLLLAGLMIRVSSTNAIVIHIFPMLEAEGLPEQRASFFVAAMFFMAIPLRFGMGVAGDYISPRKILFVGMNSAALGLLGLYLVGGVSGAIIFIVGFAIVEGVTSANWIMVSQYFGRARFASLMGFMSIFHNIGMVISPLFSGWVRDTTGSYDIVMLTFIPLFMLGGLVFAFARRPAPPVQSLRK